MSSPADVRVLLDFADPQDPAGPRTRHAFSQPQQVLQARALSEVAPLLLAAEAAAQAGRWVVGYLRYEAAPAFDAALQVHSAPPPMSGPLAWFAVFDQPRPWPAPDEGEALPARVDWLPLDQAADFERPFAQLQQQIAAGDFYQVNLTAQRRGHWVDTEPDLRITEAEAGRALFDALQRAQPGGYAALIQTGDEQWLSVSPELFFDWREGLLLTRPMKGTAPRGASPAADAARRQALLDCAK